MSLTNVWLQTLGDGLVRADQVIGIDVHQTPALTGKPAHWLLDIVLPASTGNGTRSDWSVTALHRTLVQTSQQPGDSATVLARHRHRDRAAHRTVHPSHKLKKPVTTDLVDLGTPEQRLAACRREVEVLRWR